jgi:hypothetical protein
MHSCKARDGDRVEPGEYVGGEEFVSKHAGKAVPKPSQRLGVPQVLPVKPLKSLDGGQRAPVHSIYVPYGNGTQNAADTVAKQPNRYDTQDNCCRTQGQIIEEVLRGEDVDTGGRIRR